MLISRNERKLCRNRLFEGMAVLDTASKQHILRVVSLKSCLKSCLLCKNKGRKTIISSFLRIFFLRVGKHFPSGCSEI